jgi:phospholipid/cholesterol/gamma-HCH transport system substrate-binding protein
VITQFPNRTVVVACVVFVIASIGLTMFVWRSVGGPIPFGAKSYEVRALFDNAGQLAKNADVRIAGVNVGKVAEIRPRGLRTEATLSIDAEYAPVANDVRAILRAKTLLGETFVSLTPGTAGAPRLADGGRIPAEQIEDTQPLDRVLGTLDEEGRKRLHELFVDTGAMLDGRAQDLNDAAGNFQTGTRQLDAVLRILDGQSADVSTLTRETGKVLQTVGDEQAAVQELARSGRRALSVTAERDERLAETVRATPAFLRELRATSTAAARTATTAAPMLRAFRPVAPRIAPTLEAITEASPEVEALLRDFGELTPLAREALPATASIVSALSPFMTETEPNAKQIVPVIQYVAAYRRELVAAMANIGAMAQGKAPASNGRQTAYLRTIVPFGPQSLVGASGRRADNRHNAYMAPGGLDHLKDGLLSSNCKHAGASAIPAPACRQQPGWSFAGGRSAYFQRLSDEPVVPGTVSQLRSLATFG